MLLNKDLHFYILSSSGVALPSDAGAGDLLCSFSLLSFSVGVVGAATDEGVGHGIGMGGGGKTGGGINGTPVFSTIQWQ